MKGSSFTSTRRALLGLLLSRILYAAVPASLRLLRALPSQRDGTQVRNYRANASILLWGITIFSKQNVGGGYARVTQSTEGDSTTVSLQFAGGSWPEKAHGVNRLGFIQETIVEQPSGTPVDASYFGFMTSSAEKNFDEAKKSLNEQAGSTVPYTATRGWFHGEKFTCNVFRLHMPSKMRFTECRQLIEQMKLAITGEPFEKHDLETAGVPQTFLNSMRHALLSPIETSETQLIYNGKQYRMTTTRQPDGSSTRLNGILQERGSEHRTPFQLWFDKDAQNFIPTRIEYRAKPFLKLVFEEHA